MDERPIQVSRIYKLNKDSKTKAFVDLCWNGIVIKGLRVVTGSKGMFIGMPRQQGKDGKWYNAVYPATKAIEKQISELVLEAYSESV